MSLGFKLTACLLGAIFVVFMVINAENGFQNFKGGYKKNPAEIAADIENDNIFEAKYNCEYFVKQKLKAPSTAKFPSRLDFQTVKVKDKQYIVRSYVDSQNSFGAQIRTNWTCEVNLHENSSGQIPVSVSFE